MALPDWQPAAYNDCTNKCLLKTAGNQRSSVCNSVQLKRRISRVSVAKSEDARMDNMMDDSALAGLDEEDPRAMGRFMRKMGNEMGEDLGEEFGEVVDRLEKGESPESIEEAMPDLGSDMDAAL